MYFVYQTKLIISLYSSSLSYSTAAASSCGRLLTMKAFIHSPNIYAISGRTIAHLLNVYLCMHTHACWWKLFKYNCHHHYHHRVMICMRFGFSFHLLPFCFPTVRISFSYACFIWCLLKVMKLKIMGFFLQRRKIVFYFIFSLEKLLHLKRGAAIIENLQLFVPSGLTKIYSYWRKNY